MPENCSICHVSIVKTNDPYTLKNTGNKVEFVPCCKNSFHHGCLSKWLQVSTICPLCNANLSDYYGIKKTRARNINIRHSGDFANIIILCTFIFIINMFINLFSS